MCISTCWTEAIPWWNILAENIVEALTKLFRYVGIPSYIQSDQVSRFMSGLFQQIMQELGIEQYSPSAYYPESQGNLERFHQPLKCTMKKIMLSIL